MPVVVAGVFAPLLPVLGPTAGERVNGDEPLDRSWLVVAAAAAATDLAAAAAAAAVGDKTLGREKLLLLWRFVVLELAPWEVKLAYIGVALCGVSGRCCCCAAVPRLDLNREEMGLAESSLCVDSALRALGRDDERSDDDEADEGGRCCCIPGDKAPAPAPASGGLPGCISPFEAFPPGRMQGGSSQLLQTLALVEVRQGVKKGGGIGSGLILLGTIVVRVSQRQKPGRCHRWGAEVKWEGGSLEHWAILLVGAPSCEDSAANLLTTHPMRQPYPTKT